MNLRGFLCVLLLLFQCYSQGIGAKEISTSREALIYAENLIDGGEFDEAIEYLARATTAFPADDRLLTLYGQALYESRQIQLAESAFMQAVQLNPLNTVAKTYVDVIRGIKGARDSEQSQMIESVAWDKAGDVVVLAMGFFLGTVLSGSVRSFTERRWIAKSKRLFMIGQYDNFADLLEIQLSENNLRLLRHSLRFMLEQKTLEESSEILSQYVNSEDNLNTLLRMIKLNESRRQV